jgi:hypothetical protein
VLLLISHRESSRGQNRKIIHKVKIRQNSATCVDHLENFARELVIAFFPSPRFLTALGLYFLVIILVGAVVVFSYCWIRICVLVSIPPIGNCNDDSITIQMEVFNMLYEGKVELSCWAS